MIKLQQRITAEVTVLVPTDLTPNEADTIQGKRRLRNMAMVTYIVSEDQQLLAAMQVLGYRYEANQRRPEPFICLLIDAAFRADVRNLMRIAAGYPGIAWAVHTYKNTMYGRAELFWIVGEKTEEEQRDVEFSSYLNSTHTGCRCLVDEIHALRAKRILVVTSSCGQGQGDPWIGVDIHSADLMVELGYQSIPDHSDIFYARSKHE
jgi:hypothetical protein